LKELETHRLVKRTVMDTQPITVSYELTEYGLKLKEVINQLAVWGMEHRKMIIEEMRNN
jgi:DNA-binding HxlR family transcriptional regulator